MGRKTIKLKNKSNKSNKSRTRRKSLVGGKIGSEIDYRNEKSIVEKLKDVINHLTNRISNATNYIIKSARNINVEAEHNHDLSKKMIVFKN